MKTHSKLGQQLVLVSVLEQADRANKPRRFRHAIWVTGIVAAAVVCLSAGAAMAFKYWYQQPDRVLGDTLFNALSAQTTRFTGTVDVTSRATQVKADTDGAIANNLVTTHGKGTISAGALNVTADGNVQLSPGGTAYAKLANAKDLASLFLQMSGGQSNRGIGNLVSTLDSSWVEVSADDMGNQDAAAAARSFQCATQAFNTFQHDPITKLEVTNLYQQHQFIVIKQSLGERSGSLGYKLGINKDQAKAFVAGLKGTRLYGVMRACDGGFSLDETAVVDNSLTSAITDCEMWASKADHQLTAIKFTARAQDTTATVMLKPTFNTSVTITAPSNTVTLDELRQSLQALLPTY